jgi:hypothetical protein
MKLNKEEDPKWFKPVFWILMIILAILVIRVANKTYDPNKNPIRSPRGFTHI